MPPRTGRHTWNIEHLSPKSETYVKHVLENWCRGEVKIIKIGDKEVEYKVL